MTNATETDLIRAARLGDRRAASQLIERFRRLATTTANLALHNADDAQDVAQEALVYALLHLNQCKDDRKFGAWLRQVTFSLCADYRRRRGTRRLGEPIALLHESAEEARHAERLTVQSALENLREPHRTTVLLHYVGGWSVEETASLLGIPHNTVRSRLMAAKARLRIDLDTLIPERKTKMATETASTASSLTETHTSLLYSAFPDCRIVSSTETPEPWMPFRFRIQLETRDGAKTAVEIRDDISAERAALLPALERAGISGPRLRGAPVSDGRGGYLSLCDAAAGENLLLWALGGTPHRLRIATERAFDAIDLLQNATATLQTDPLTSGLPRRSLTDEAEAIVAAGGAWLSDAWFLDALKKTRDAVADISDPLVYTDDTHFFPNFVRIAPESEVEKPLGWPGDTTLAVNPVVELVNPYGRFGDPLLGLAMVWIYDCYPFVHTGFVEQFLWRRGKTRRDFAPRLALRALQTLQRETEPGAAGEYPDALRGWVSQGLGWM